MHGLLNRSIFSLIHLFILVLLFGCSEESSNSINEETLNVKGLIFKKVETGRYFLHDLKKENSNNSNGSKYVYKGYIDKELQRTVKIIDPFYVSTTEITNQQWHDLLEDNLVVENGNLPISNKSPKEIEDFIIIVNKKLKGFQVKLPDSDEWEIAYRYKNNINDYYWGPGNDQNTNLLKEHAWYFRNTANLMPVGLKTANKLGLYDLNGNVAEICKQGNKFVTKGGGIGVESKHFPSEVFYLAHFYQEIDNNFKYKDIGFRLILFKLVN